MKRVLLRYYDAANLGDDLFVGIIISRYKNEFLLSRGFLQRTFHSHGNVAIRQKLIDEYAYRLTRKIFSYFRYVVDWSLRSGDLHVYIGGSIFIENDNLSRWIREKNFYRKLNKSYYIIGSNFGPYKSEEFIDIVGDILAGAEDVCFRDKISYEAFKELPNVRLATDVAFTLDTSLYDTKSDKLAVFSVINGDKRFSPEITEKYEQEIVNLSRKLANQGYEVVLMSFCKYEGDEDAVSRIIENGGEGFKSIVSVHNYSGDLDESLALLAKSEIIVASRFHGAILGLLFGKKVLPMAYSAKTTNILKDMKFRGPVIDINKIEDFDGLSFDFDTLEVNDVSDQIELAEKQFQELDKVLTKR